MILNTKRYVNASSLATAILDLKGKPLNITDYKPFELIYNISPPELTLQAGRQIGKSVSLSAILIVNSILRNHFVSLYISPLSQQTSRFSSLYLQAFFESPLIKKHFVKASGKKNVFEKEIGTGSRIFLGYAQTEEDSNRIRGISADSNLFDEVQDISMDAIPIILETLGASEYAFKRYAGTAKTENNSLSLLFKRGSMCEWVVKCPGCGKYNIPNDFDNCMAITLANPAGAGCMYCGKLLDVSTGMWIAAKPLQKDHLSFHLPQLIFPARNKPKKWKEIITKISDGSYSASKIANEVFGVPSGIGGRILTLREAMACCNIGQTAWDEGFPSDKRNINCTILGVDWSVTDGKQSYTVISVLGYDYRGKIHVLYSQRLNSVDILDQVARVEYLFHKFQCSMIGSDRGVGVLQAQLLKQNLGEDKVVMVNYCAAKNALRWAKDSDFYAADRTMNMDTIVLKAKMGIDMLETPCWNLMAPFWDDALNVFEEETLSGRRVYRKDEDKCDDWLHSMVFANVAFQVLKGEFKTLDKVPDAKYDFSSPWN